MEHFTTKKKIISIPNEPTHMLQKLAEEIFW